MAAFHENVRVARAVFLAVGALLPLLLIALVVPYWYMSSDVQSGLLIGFYSVLFGLQAVLGAVFLIYGVFLFREHKKASRVFPVKVLVSLSVLLAFILAKLIVGVYMWLQTFSVGEGVAFPGLQNIRFGSYAHAVAFYVFVFILPGMYGFKVKGSKVDLFTHLLLFSS